MQQNNVISKYQIKVTCYISSCFIHQLIDGVSKLNSRTALKCFATYRMQHFKAVRQFNTQNPYILIVLIFSVSLAHKKLDPRHLFNCISVALTLFNIDTNCFHDTLYTEKAADVWPELCSMPLVPFDLPFFFNYLLFALATRQQQQEQRQHKKLKK